MLDGNNDRHRTRREGRLYRTIQTKGKSNRTSLTELDAKVGYTELYTKVGYIELLDTKAGYTELDAKAGYTESRCEGK